MKTTAFNADLSGAYRALPHFWEHTIGSGHATLALRADYQEQLARCRRELGFRHVRFHGILSDDMGTLIVSQDKKIYSFFNTDRIVDFLLSIGMKPLVELSFMPTCLASGDTTVMHYKDNVTPPTDFGAWAELIDKLVRHWIDRYGAEEVRTWPFEVWNEPNLTAFWTGDQDAYFRLYETTANTIKNIDRAIPVGGPATAANGWLMAFHAFCRTNKVPLDFISTHIYPTDALGTADQDTVSQLAASPRDIMRAKATEAHQAAENLPLYYTEWSSSSNPHDPLHDEPFAAAFAARAILENNGLVNAYSWWTFSDIFDENYFPSVPFYGGFGLLNLYGIPKPTYRAYELLHALGDTIYPAKGSHPTVDVYITRDSENRLTVFVTNHALPRHPIETEQIKFTIANCSPPRAGATLRRVDDTHANARAVWETMGSPEYPSVSEVALLEAASASVPMPFSVTHDAANKTLSFTLEIPAHGIASVAVPLSGVRQ